MNEKFILLSTITFITEKQNVICIQITVVEAETLEDGTITMVPMNTYIVEPSEAGGGGAMLVVQFYQDDDEITEISLGD